MEPPERAKLLFASLDTVAAKPSMGAAEVYSGRRIKGIGIQK